MIIKVTCGDLAICRIGMLESIMVGVRVTGVRSVVLKIEFYVIQDH
jgi:hypothetical protein